MEPQHCSKLDTKEIEQKKEGSANSVNRQTANVWKGRGDEIQNKVYVLDFAKSAAWLSEFDRQKEQGFPQLPKGMGLFPDLKLYLQTVFKAQDIKLQFFKLQGNHP